MLEGDLAYSLISLAAGIVCLGLGLYIFRKNPHLMISQVLVITMSLLTINAVFIFLLANAPDATTASLFARATIFVSILVGTSFVYLSSYLPYERRDSWVLQNRTFFPALSLMLALIPAALIDQVYSDQYGYWLDYSPALFLWLGLGLAISIIPVYVLTPICRQSTDKVVRRHVTVMSIGVMLPILFVIAEVVTERAGLLIPHLPAFGLLLTGILFFIAVLRLKLFIIEPVKEDKLEPQAGKDPGIKLISGHCDLIKSKKADLSYRMFVAEVAAGNKGLLITRVHPDQVREKYGLVKTPILWLSGQPGPDRMDPASLSILQHTVVDFLQKGSTSVILLDGLEYLVSENQIDKVLRFIYTVHDAVVISGSKFIVPVDPDILESKDMALFEKEFVVIEESSV
jgi:hypothetical protein